MFNFKTLALTALTAFTLAAPAANAGLADRYGAQHGGDDAFVAQHVRECKALYNNADYFREDDWNGYAVKGNEIYRIELGNALLSVPSSAVTHQGVRVECKYEFHAPLNSEFSTINFDTRFQSEFNIEGNDLVQYSVAEGSQRVSRNVRATR